jgi:hypothetical protein
MTDVPRAMLLHRQVKVTGKKVLERVGGAAASVGHTAKQVGVHSPTFLPPSSFLTCAPFDESCGSAR